MFENFDKDGVSYTVNHAAVIKSKDSLAVTKLLAVDLMARPYMQVGDFFQKISTADLNTLMEIIGGNDGIHTNPQFGELILIAEMLATAEGLSNSETIDMMTDRANQLISFVLIVSLERKGLVKVHYNNMSFGEEYGDKIVVEKI